MNLKRPIQLGVIAVAMLLFGASLTLSKPEYTKKEGKSCTTCHVKAGSKDLNDVGKCYEKGKTLKECMAPK